ncbi:hypothetical protein BB561_003238 [Smittium simulii]|uniref:V-type proton ATPase subunit a n=1 Tax=Smittium simulii TaxID=133385 RepID=A0A2T9YMG3_9FUNG|nr:hypothetical protein BB561_003238 [Smittium simulii]
MNVLLGGSISRPNARESSLFRSESMSFIRIFIPIEISRFVVTELGEAGVVQFKDLNENKNSFQRSFAMEIRRFDEIERKLYYFQKELANESIPICEEIDNEFAYRPRGPQEIEEMEEKIFEYENKIKKFNNSFLELKDKWAELVLNGLALHEASNIFQKIGKAKKVTYHSSAPARRMQSNHNTALTEFTLEDLSITGAARNSSLDHENQYEEEGVVLESQMMLGSSEELMLGSDTFGSRNSVGSLNNLESSHLRPISNFQPNTVVEVDDINVRYITGVIRSDRLITLEKILWRSLRGNMYMEYADLEIDQEDQIPGIKIDKMSFFVVFAHSEDLQSRITKIAQSFGSTIYNISNKSFQRSNDLSEIEMRKNDIKIVLQNNKEALKYELKSIAEFIHTWSLVAYKEKAIYFTMDLFNYDEGRRCLIADGWCPSNDLDKVKSALHSATAQSGSTTSAVVSELNTNLEPPSYIKTNKFTQGFQNIIDSYGIPKYGEVNPGLFTMVTFPFLFAIMFGDLGHGIIMTLAAFMLVYFERSLSRIKSEEFSMIFQGRYMILMMGIYSIVVGLLYNDIFSRAMHIYSPGWTWPKDIKIGELVAATQKKGYVYPLGIDPTWHHANNSLLFLNSYKMKLSILLGVVHMIFGMVLQVYNARHFHKPINIKHVFLPQVIFYLSIFGYLSFTIVYKWCINWYAIDSQGKNIYNSPPSLLNMLIYMFLNPGKVDPSDQLFSGQATIQVLLIITALVCIPWMLLAKPLILRSENNKIVSEGYLHLNSSVANRLSMMSHGSSNESAGRQSNESLLLNGPNSNSRFSAESSNFDNASRSSLDYDLDQVAEAKKFDFGDIMMNSTIHTIEVCLNGVSHTASYLRLWALSLAHAQLSQVLWQMTLHATFMLPDNKIKPFFIAFAFCMWFVLTVSILLIMEGLSAFLHALRLHWVEFNSKFYEGTGYKFEPFSFKKDLEL